MSLSLLILILIYGSVDSFFDYPNIRPGKASVTKNGDLGEPLFLTRYVEQGDIETGRKLARVPSDQWLGVESYAGFFTVDKDHDTNNFFWYFPAMTNAENAPVILWLNGGLRGSILMGVFQETGPFSIKDGKLDKREFGWTLNHHMIYVDCPTGTGFSFTNSSASLTENQIGAELYSTMTQFFLLFPELQKNDFYILGQLYGGKFATALAIFMYKNKEQQKLKCNLKGIAIANGWVDPVNQIRYDEFLYGLGKIDRNGMEALKKQIDMAELNINEKKWKSATAAIIRTQLSMIIMTNYQWNNLMNYLSLDQYLKDLIIYEDYRVLFDLPAVRKSLHVGNLTLVDYYTSEFQERIAEDISKSVAPWIRELYEANYCDIIIYHGHLDVIQPYSGIEKFIYKMNLTDYADANIEQWKVDGDVAGYIKKCHRLTQIMVRNAGQLVPRDQPYWAWKMITSITNKTGFMEDRVIDGSKK